VSLSGSAAAAAAGDIARRVADVWVEPTKLESALLPAEGVTAGNSPFWLLNQTGADVSFWLGTAASGAADAGGARACRPVCQRVVQIFGI
jgi:hypothetical protein